MRGGGVDGNELLTSATGALLVVLLAVIGVTIISLGPLLSVHLFVGIVLVGPLMLKLASTGYRFARYYARDPVYTAKGPPPTPLRLIAPIVVASTIVVMVSGVALLLEGPRSRDALLPIHKVSFFVWVAFTSLHVLAHLPALARTAPVSVGGSRSSSRTSGSTGRTLALAGVLAGGVVLAIVLIPEFGPWLHAHALRQH